MTQAKLLFVLLFICCSTATQAIQIQSLKSGQWGSAQVWSTGTVPDIKDTVIIHEGHQITGSVESAKALLLILKGAFSFSSPGKGLNVKTIQLLDSGKFNSDVLGSVNAEELFVLGNNVIEGINLTIEDLLEVKGAVRFVRKSGTINVNEISVLATGSWNVDDDQSFEIVKGIENKGIWNSGGGSYFFNGNCLLVGKKIAFSRLKIKGQLTSRDSLIVKEEIEELSPSVLVNEGYLEFQTTPGKYKLSHLDLRFKGNELVLSEVHHQVIPLAIQNHYQNIQLVTSGKVFLQDSVNLWGDLLIGKETELVLTTSLLNVKGANAKLTLKDRAALVFEDYTSTENNVLTAFSTTSFIDDSWLKVINSQRDFKVPNLGFNNLFIDLSAAGAIFSLLGDSLQVQKELRLSSETAFDFSDKVVQLSGDWYGGTSVGLKASKIIYEGIGHQRIAPFDYDTLLLANSSADTLEFLGNYEVNFLKIKKGKLKSGSLTIYELQIDSLSVLYVGGTQVHFSHKILNNGLLKLVSDQTKVVFDALVINNGVLENESSADPVLQNDVVNNGKLIGCLGTACTWTVKNNVSFSGSGSTFIPRIWVEDTLINKGELSIEKSMLGNGWLINKGCLKLAMNADQITVDVDAKSFVNNRVEYNSANKQIIGNLSDGNYSELVFSGGDEKVLETNVGVSSDFKILAATTLNVNSKLITGTPTGKLEMETNARMILGDPTIDFSTPFPLNFKRSNCWLDSSSIVQYNAWKNQEVSTVPIYGSLILSDGTGTAHQKVLFPKDSLLIKGSLDLAESSLELVLNDQVLWVQGDWEGPGNLKFTTGNFHLHGNGFNTGVLAAGQGSVYYQGGMPQEVKKGTYYRLTVDKDKGVIARLNAGKGELVVQNKLKVQEGVFELKGEKVTVLGQTVVVDQLLFTSKAQSKTFNDVVVEESGRVNNEYGVDITIKGDVENKGQWINKGGRIYFSDTIKNQKMNNSGWLVCHGIIVDKKGKALQLEGDIELLDTLSLQNSPLKVNGASVLFKKNAFLKGEDDSSPILGNNSRFTHVFDLDATTQFVSDSSKENNTGIAGFGIELKSPVIHEHARVDRWFKDINLNAQDKALPVAYQLSYDSTKGGGIEYKINYHPYQLQGLPVDSLAIYGSDTITIDFVLEKSSIHFAHKTIQGKLSANRPLLALGSKNVSALPVELLSFSTYLEGGSQVLKWESASEWHVNHYQLTKAKQNLKEVWLANVSAVGFNGGVYLHNIEAELGQDHYFFLYQCNALDSCKKIGHVFQPALSSSKSTIRNEEELIQFCKNKSASTNVVFYDVAGRCLGSDYKLVLNTRRVLIVVIIEEDKIETIKLFATGN